MCLLPAAERSGPLKLLPARSVAICTQSHGTLNRKVLEDSIPGPPTPDDGGIEVGGNGALGIPCGSGMDFMGWNRLQVWSTMFSDSVVSTANKTENSQNSLLRSFVSHREHVGDGVFRPGHAWPVKTLSGLPRASESPLIKEYTLKYDKKPRAIDYSLI